MAGLTFDTQLSAGQTALDQGITGLTLLPVPNGAVLITTSGPRGGVTSYTLSGTGVALADTAYFDVAWSSDAVLDTRVLTPTGTPFLAVSAGGEVGIWGYSIDETGQFGAAAQLSALDTTTGTVRGMAEGGSGDLFVSDGVSDGFQTYGWTGSSYTLDQTIPDTTATYAEDVMDLAFVQQAGQTFVLSAGQSDRGVTAFTETSNGLQTSGNLGAGEGLGVLIPTDMDVVKIGGRHFVILGSSAGSGAGGAISVMELRESGELLPVDQITDTLGTRFGNLQALDVIEVSGRVFVTAGGGDEGLTLFTLLPDGRLHLLEVVVGSAAAGLTNITAIETWQQGDTLHLFASSEGEAGVAHFTLSLSDLGQTLFAGDTGGPTAGTEDDDLIAGSYGDDVLIGLGGDDILTDGAGQDTLTGGAGADRFVLSADGLGDTISDFDPISDRLDLSAWPMLYDPTQISTTPMASGAIVTWRQETLTLNRAGGGPLSEDEVLNALIDAPHRQPFLDQLGGPGLNVDGGSGADDINGGPGMDRLSGLAGDDTLTGLGSEDTLMGGDGNDMLSGGEGADQLDGGAGRDAASYDGSPEGVLVRLWAGDGQGGEADGDTLTAIEDLTGSSHADTLVGDASANVLHGGDGPDALWGNSGDDTLRGGAGADVINGQNGHDTADYATSPSGVTVRLWAGDGLGGDAEGDSLSGIEALVGSGFADTLVGDAGPNTLDGGPGYDALWGNAGDDRLEGGAGADQLQGQAGKDWARYTQSDAAVTVKLWNGTGTGGHADGDRLVGIENVEGSDHADTLVGDSGSNHLRGGAGTDALWGNSGDDVLEGGAGPDQLHGQDGLDWARYTTSPTGVTVRLWAGDGSGGDADGDTLIGIENLHGSAHSDTLVGDAGANRFFGGDGADDIWANDGDDTLEGGRGGDTLRGQGGADTASYASSTTGVTVRLWAGDGWGGDADGDTLVDIENAEGSDHNDVLSGSGGNNVLSGRAGRDQIWAGNGNDTLSGGVGDDVLRGQAGNDLLFGNEGADTFVFADNDGFDEIADFGMGDRIDLSSVTAITDFDDLQAGAAADSPEGVRIDTGNGEILIAEVSLANLDLTDFLF